MIDPFRVCSVELLRQFRPYSDRQAWLVGCQALGADEAALVAYDADAVRYAATTPYPNSDIVAYCRQLAINALRREEALPTSAAQAVEADNHRRWQAVAAWIDGKGRPLRD